MSLDWTDHDSFLLCGLQNGRAQLVHIDSKRPLPPFNISTANDEIVGIKGSCFTFFTGSAIFQLNSGFLDLEDLHAAIMSQDFSKLQRYQQLCQVEEQNSNIGDLVYTQELTRYI